MFATKKRKFWLVALTVFLLLLLGLVIAGGWYVGRTLTLTLQLNGNASESFEYGSAYQDPGASAVLKTTLLPEFSMELPVWTHGSVNPDKVGAYAISYRVGILWFSRSALRTVSIVDTQKPVITLKDPEVNFILPGQEFQEPGYSAYDDYDGDITHLVTWSMKENVITYVVEDSSGNHTIVQRTVNFEDPVAPTITLKGEQNLTVYLGRDYRDPGFQATDNFDGDITDRVKVTGGIDAHTPGTYTVSYTVADSFGNTTTVERKVTVAVCPPADIMVPDGKVIYLTFDDGPSQYTPRLLEVLKRYNVKATFFVVDNSYADLITQIREQGHSIGVHTSSHVYSEIYASEKAYFDDFQKIHNLVYEKAGLKTTLMRFPGGSSNRVSAKHNEGIMTRLSKIVTDYGLQYFDWNVNSMDAGGAKTAEEVYRNVIEGAAKHDYSVVLQHDIHGFSVDAVEKIIQWGLDNGYTFLPLEPTSPPCHQTIMN